MHDGANYHVPLSPLTRILRLIDRSSESDSPLACFPRDLRCLFQQLISSVSRYSILDTRYSVLGTRYSILDTQYSIVSSSIQILKKCFWSSTPHVGAFRLKSYGPAGNACPKQNRTASCIRIYVGYKRYHTCCHEEPYSY